MKDTNVTEKPESVAASTPASGYAALVNALREAVLRLEEWGPGPADAFWINETAKPLIQKYSKPHSTDYPTGSDNQNIPKDSNAKG